MKKYLIPFLFTALLFITIQVNAQQTDSAANTSSTNYQQNIDNANNARAQQERMESGHKDSVSMAKSQHRIEGNLKDANKLQGKIDKKQRKIEKQQKRIERKENKKDKKMNRIEKEQKKIDKTAAGNQ